MEGGEKISIRLTVTQSVLKIDFYRYPMRNKNDSNGVISRIKKGIILKKICIYFWQNKFSTSVQNLRKVTKPYKLKHSDIIIVHAMIAPPQSPQMVNKLMHQSID